MSKGKLSYSTSSTRGGSNSSWKPTGCLLASVDGNENKIVIDAYVGTGLNYQAREKCLINIENQNFTWSGTFDELLKKLAEKI